MKRILIIDDDRAILEGVAEGLELEGFNVLMATNGKTGFEKALREELDVILLDLKLPKKKGAQICRDLRRADIHTPIIVLTATEERHTIIKLLEIGADDYVTKPYDLPILVARINACMRRALPKKDERVYHFTFDNYEIDFQKLEITKSGKKLDGFSAREFDVLQFLIEHDGRVVSRQELLKEVWGYTHSSSTRTVDNYILKLRKKIEANPAYPEFIITVHRAGYKFISGNRYDPSEM